MNMVFSRNGRIHKPFLFLVFLLTFQLSQAQIVPKKNYPVDYFRYPVEAKVGLAANFGELRSNHYHMGLDCRTDQVQNKKVMAAADGYVARIKIEPFGFGRAIYINHPNGLTTLYAHLNDFFPALEDYVKEQQYRQESWSVDLEIPEDLFPVKKGEFIARSGTTGGSMGPHTHFEIRDTKTDKVLNPLLFNFPVPDHVPPTIVRLAVYDRCLSTYSQSPKLYSLKHISGGYETNSALITFNTDKISFGITANDKVSGSSNPNGIYAAVLYLDENPIIYFVLDSISYDETRYVNAHIDYKTKASGGPYIEHLSRLPGYPESVYHDIAGDGVLEIMDDSVHDVRIAVYDAAGNKSDLKFKIKKGIINEHGSISDTLHPVQHSEFRPLFANVYESEDAQLLMPANALYDSIRFTSSAMNSTDSKSFSRVHTLLSGVVPAQEFFTVKITPSKAIPAGMEDRILMKRTWGKETDLVKAKKEGDWYAGQFREFGNFELILDTVPPLPGLFWENAVLTKSSRILIHPEDDNGEIQNFRATLDGKWLRFTNDKGKLFIYHFDEKCPKGKHELTINVEDLAGNMAEKTFHFTR